MAEVAWCCAAVTNTGHTTGTDAYRCMYAGPCRPPCCTSSSPIPLPRSTTPNLVLASAARCTDAHPELNVKQLPVLCPNHALLYKVCQVYVYACT